MIIVTGGAGFIGSNMVKGLNDKGYDDILVVDNMSSGEKFKNLLALDIKDYVDKHDYILDVKAGKYNQDNVEAIFHIGACSDTMEYNGKYMMANNYEYSRELLHFSLKKGIPFIYASSASVYGNGANGFREETACEGALNVYAFSKLQFDRYVRRALPAAKSQVAGLRFFNVYGPQENHKGKMASIVYQLYRQLQTSGVVKLFKGINGYADGEQRRDFIYVKDIVAVNLFLFEHPEVSGVFNCGTGQARSFNDVAKALISAYGKGRIEYVDFPETLRGKYQSFTEADTGKIVAAGYERPFTTLETAIGEYCRYLDGSDGYLTR
ncbi:MAG: hldD [Firmicutes bacterium]|nr:hldD [Bacillota bacterium]